MNVLKKIATPFIALWRWIKETAWVQPLLIVGIIFALIFSIPYISQGIQSWIASWEDDMAYFETSLLSLENCKDNQGDSQAEHFFDAFSEAQEEWQNGNKERSREILNEYSEGNDRFFLFFVQDDCSGCSTLKDGLEYLYDNWSDYVNEDLQDYEVPNIAWRSIDVGSTFDDDYYDDNNTTPIQELMTSTGYLSFYRIAMTVVSTTSYYYNLNNLSDSSDASDSQSSVYTNTENLIDVDRFQTPTSVVIDLTDDNTSRYLIKDIFYSIPTRSSDTATFDSARFLVNAWTTEGVFSSDYR